MAPKKQIVYVNGERREIEGDLFPRSKPIPLILETLDQLKARDAKLIVNCRSFACWKTSEVPARGIEGPGHLTNLKDLTFFGLKCSHCRCALMMVHAV